MQASQPTQLAGRKRRGYTLFEMLMVQGLLVVLVAASWPMLRSPLGKNQLVSAARQVRVELVKARHRAIETGVPQQFRFQPKSNVFEIVPVVAVKPASADSFSRLEETSPNADPFASRETARQTKDEARRELPDGILFCDSKEETLNAESSDIGSTELAMADTSAESLSYDEEDAEWSAPILFYPNGRTSDATIRLQGKKDIEIEVALRGLTGIPTVGEPQRRKEER